MRDCKRKDDLMSFLYDEFSQADRASFEYHLNDCDSCRTELASFNRVRDDLSAWQIGYSPKVALTTQRNLFELLRDLLLLFPVWARGGALTAASLALLLAAGYSIGVRIPSYQPVANNRSDDETKMMIESALAKQKELLTSEFMGALNRAKVEMKDDNEIRLKDAKAEYQSSLRTLQLQVAVQLRNNASEKHSIRSFFAMEDSTDQSGERE